MEEEIEVTAGFYRYVVERERLDYAPNFVLNKDYELRKELKDTYEYPYNDWYWFETLEEAHTFFWYGFETLEIDPNDPENMGKPPIE